MFDEMTGNETSEEFAEALAEALREIASEGDKHVGIHVVRGFQPWITFRLRNGAEFQITPVRSSWPTDGTSRQWDDDEDDAE